MLGFGLETVVRGGVGIYNGAIWGIFTVPLNLYTRLGIFLSFIFLTSTW